MTIYEETLQKLENLCYKNKYTKWYINIVKKAIERDWNKKTKVYKEKHHLWKKGHSEKTKKQMSIDTILSGRNKGGNNPMYGKPSASTGKKWYHDDINMIERYFTPGTQPENFKEGRLKRVNTII